MNGFQLVDKLITVSQADFFLALKKRLYRIAVDFDASSIRSVIKKLESFL